MGWAHALAPIQQVEREQQVKLQETEILRRETERQWIKTLAAAESSRHSLEAGGRAAADALMNDVTRMVAQALGAPRLAVALSRSLGGCAVPGVTAPGQHAGDTRVRETPPTGLPRPLALSPTRPQPLTPATASIPRRSPPPCR